MVGVGAELEIAGEFVEAKVAFFLLGSVAAHAVLLDEGFVGLRRLRDNGQAEAEGEQSKGFGKTAWGGHGTGQKEEMGVRGGRYVTKVTGLGRVKFPSIR